MTVEQLNGFRDIGCWAHRRTGPTDARTKQRDAPEPFPTNASVDELIVAPDCAKTVSETVVDVVLRLLKVKKV